MDIYSHALPTMQDDAMKQLADAFQGFGRDMSGKEVEDNSEHGETVEDENS